MTNLISAAVQSGCYPWGLKKHCQMSNFLWNHEFPTNEKVSKNPPDDRVMNIHKIHDVMINIHKISRYPGRGSSVIGLSTSQGMSSEPPDLCVDWKVCYLIGLSTWAVVLGEVNAREWATTPLSTMLTSLITTKSGAGGDRGRAPSASKKWSCRLLVYCQKYSEH